jgi:hypothetical protein
MKAPHHIQTSHQIWDNHDDTSNQFTIPTNVKMNPTAKKKLAPRFKPLSPFMLPLPLGLRASMPYIPLSIHRIISEIGSAGELPKSASLD